MLFVETESLLLPSVHLCSRHCKQKNTMIAIDIVCRSTGKASKGDIEESIIV